MRGKIIYECIKMHVSKLKGQTEEELEMQHNITKRMAAGKQIDRDCCKQPMLYRLEMLIVVFIPLHLSSGFRLCSDYKQIKFVFAHQIFKADSVHYYLQVTRSEFWVMKSATSRHRLLWHGVGAYVVRR